MTILDLHMIDPPYQRRDCSPGDERLASDAMLGRPGRRA